MTAARVARWAEEHPLSPPHVDCATAVMLKILDGKCKMPPTEKLVMALLYEQVKQRPGEKLGADIHQLIADARKRLDEDMQFLIYEKRVLAETMISRPVMKGFKAMLRERGLLEPERDWEETEA
ncbi:hypothetical protein HA520_11285 [Azotobacter chroococcum]|uniref:Uncharacterized protein n=1 Tax=Azotobacter chroococcum TaxID=353 RepID=A0AA44C8D2_9GAMM|nr:hypothetical protein [Azotobacter chroococcum]NHN77857.1 hypothetical protein [Azotobacter chroococcum]TBW13198.1 hypothetical protein E0E50_00300 [Azotobacter chroococcum subsp. isscasi]